MIVPGEINKFPSAVSIGVAVQRVTMLRVVRPWTTYGQTYHTHDSTQDYDIDGHSTGPPTDRQTTHMTVQRITMLRVVAPWTIYRQTDHTHDSTEDYNVEGHSTLDHLQTDRPHT